MSKSTIVLRGETLDDISTRLYGVKSAARQLQRANPGLSAILTEGAELFVPKQAGVGTVTPNVTSFSGSPEQVNLTIDGVDFTDWDSITITRSIDTTPIVTVNAPWEPANLDFRQRVKPFGFQEMIANVGGAVLFTGVMLGSNPSSSGTASKVVTSGYGITGVLNDCTMPSSAFPIEYNGLNLEEIARDLCEPFGIDVVFEGAAGNSFDKVSLNETDKIMQFLSKLAKQRNFVISETVDGELWFLKSTEGGEPVAVLTSGESPVFEISAGFDPQQYYSHVTGIAPTTSEDGEGAQVTKPNPHVTGVLRPLTFQVDDSKNESLTDAVDTKIARMFANMASWSVSVPTWLDATGALWEPNTTVEVTAPHAMIYNQTELLVRSVEFNASGGARTAKLNLVMVGAFAGIIPEALPWVE